MSLSAWGAAAACQTDAVGVDECRRIEQARCVAARQCDFGIDGSDELATCERFARDNCLHGFALKDAPRTSDVDACVRAIQTAGTCAANHQPLAQNCAGLGMASAGATTVCDVIQSPEQAPACRFLIGEPAGSSTGGAAGDATVD